MLLVSWASPLSSTSILSFSSDRVPAAITGSLAEGMSRGAVRLNIRDEVMAEMNGNERASIWLSLSYVMDVASMVSSSISVDVESVRSLLSIPLKMVTSFLVSNGPMTLPTSLIDDGLLVDPAMITGYWLKLAIPLHLCPLRSITYEVSAVRGTHIQSSSISS